MSSLRFFFWLHLDGYNNGLDYLDMENRKSRVPMGRHDNESQTHAVFAFGVHDDTPVSFSCLEPISVLLLFSCFIPTPGNSSEKRLMGGIARR